MSNPHVGALLRQLHTAANPDPQWDDNAQIRDVMFVSPDRHFAWLFRIEPNGQEFPHNTNTGYHNCNLYIRDVRTCGTVSECLGRFSIIPEGSDFQVLNSIGELIDPAIAPVQTVVLKSKIDRAPI